MADVIRGESRIVELWVANAYFLSSTTGLEIR